MWLVPSGVAIYIVWRWSRRLRPVRRLVLLTIATPVLFWPWGFAGGHGAFIAPLFLVWPFAFGDTTLVDSFGPKGLYLATAFAISFLIQLLLFSIHRRREKGDGA